MNVWIGDNYEASETRLLVLGESWYGEIEPLCEYIPRWARREINDAMFSRLFNAASGFHTSQATTIVRLEWWNLIAFYNFVPGNVGQSRESRPTKAAFAEARKPFRAVLDRIRPRGVWIIGKEQAAFSTEVIKHFGADYEVTPHTASYGLSATVLAGSRARLVERVRAQAPGRPT